MDEYDDDDGYDDQFTATYNGPSDWQGVEVHGQKAQAEDQDPENVEDKLDKNWPDWVKILIPRTRYSCYCCTCSVTEKTESKSGPNGPLDF